MSTGIHLQSDSYGDTITTDSLGHEFIHKYPTMRPAQAFRSTVRENKPNYSQLLTPQLSIMQPGLTVYSLKLVSSEKLN